MLQGFKYACFVSYCHGQRELVKTFIDQLRDALEAELETRLDEPLYIDQDRLEPGYRYNEELARAICQSVCMIVVYSPRYGRHEYCVREFEAMVQLEEARRELLGAAGHGHAFIIPIIFRGDENVPARIKDHLHYVDFSKFTLAEKRLAENAQYAEAIKRIARVIDDNYSAFQDTTANPCAKCEEFSLPAAPVERWRPPAFVNR